MNPLLVSLYYKLKPLIPRSLQIAVRRSVTLRKREQYLRVWPIDDSAGKAPKHWRGWPDGKEFALVLTHDVDTAKGQKKCAELAKLEMRYDFRSSFNFVPRRYSDSPELRKYLVWNGFEVGVHGLYHDGNYFRSRKTFCRRAIQINQYLKDWGAVGFRSPSMFSNPEWILDLDVEYDTSTFDTDPFEPQPDGVKTIFPFWVQGNSDRRGYVELPYTMPQDFTLFVLMRENDIGVWKRKLDWIARKGGMVVMNTHPDYMNFNSERAGVDTYPAEQYESLLDYLRTKFSGRYWHVLPKEMARFARAWCAPAGKESTR
jgi:hypothetical protein